MLGGVKGSLPAVARYAALDPASALGGVRKWMKGGRMPPAGIFKASDLRRHTVSIHMYAKISSFLPRERRFRVIGRLTQQ